MPTRPWLPASALFSVMLYACHLYVAEALAYHLTRMQLQMRLVRAAVWRKVDLVHVAVQPIHLWVFETRNGGNMLKRTLFQRCYHATRPRTRAASMISRKLSAIFDVSTSTRLLNLTDEESAEIE